MNTAPVLEVCGLSGGYREKNVFGGRGKEQEVLHDVSFTLYRGEILGLVGESGTGKTTLCRLILGLQPPSAGTVRITPPPDRPGALPQMIFKDPASALNPAFSVRRILEEPLKLAKVPAAGREAKILEMLALTGMDPECLSRQPAQLSGGQRQRVCIAAALLAEPSLLLADEPVSALDVTVQAQVLSLLRSLRQKLELSMLFISHDLGVVARLCDRVLVMKDGRIVEQGEIGSVFQNPQHPYTQRLLADSL